MQVNNASNTDKEREFEKLYLESYELVYNYVRTRIHDKEDAEDIISEAYLRAARAYSSFDPTRAKFSTWVIKISINCMNDYWRKHRFSLAPLDEIPDKVVAQPAEQDNYAIRDFVDHLMLVLDDNEREIVLLKCREDMRNVDIAAELGINPSTVSTIFARAVAKMREAAERSE